MKKTLLLISVISAFNMMGQTVNPNFIDGEIYVKIHNSIPVYENKGELMITSYPVLNEMHQMYPILKAYQSFKNTRSEDLKHTFRIKFSDAKNIDDILNILNHPRNKNLIEYAEKVPLYRTSLTPNDLGPLSGSGNQWHLYKIKGPEAWDISTGNSSIIVGIVDDAVHINHPDLSPVIYVNTSEIPGNNIDDDGNGYIDDINGFDIADMDNNPNPDVSSMDHGTHVAGISGAATDNNLGVASIGFGVSILPVKCTNTPGFVTDGYEGITYAADMGAHVINCSWGGSGGGTTGQNVVNYAYNQGSLIVAAAGNDNVSSVFYPAGYNNVISVASTANNDQKSSFSNYGSWIDISSPGSSINSTGYPGNSYEVKSGTSMASPLVAGLCGLMFSVNPSVTRANVEQCLLTTADDIDPQNPSYIGQLGAGRINAEQALLCVQNLATPLPNDVSVQNIITPNTNYVSCNTLTLNVSMNIRNNGTNTQTSIPVYYQLDANPPVNATYTGSLASGNVVVYNFSTPLVISGPGTYTLKCATALPGDGNTANDEKTITITVTGNQTIFNEDFESGNFTSSGWTVDNPDASNGWLVTNVSGTMSGTKAAFMEMFFYQNGQRDRLISPVLNLSSASDVVLSFDHAHRRRNQSFSDSLIIKVSTNGGSTFPNTVFARAENGTGNFATGPITNDIQFSPTTTSDWCYAGGVGATCFTVDLSAFDGEPNVKIMFETYSNTGNDLFLDNVKITASCSSFGGLPPTANFSAVNTTVCAGSSIVFTNTSLNGTTYQWSFPGGTPSASTATNPTVTYNTAGTYNVQLIATNSYGSDTLLLTNYVTIHAIPVPNFTYSATGLTINFFDQSLNTTSWSWNFGDGNSSSLQNPTHTYAVPGTYNICLTADNANCNANIFCSSITVTSGSSGPPPIAGFSTSQNLVCQGNTVNFYDQSTNSPTGWMWSFPGGFPASSTQQNPTITYNTPGVYNVQLIAINAGGTDTILMTNVITVSTAPVANYGETITGLMVQFSDQSNGASSWSWDFGDGSTSSLQDPTHVFSASGSYNVCLTITSPGCSPNTYCETINVTSAGGLAPSAAFSVSGSNICQGQTIQFFDQSSNSPTYYNWTFQGGTPATSNLANPVISYAIPGTYSVTLVAGNPSGVDSVVMTSFVQVYANPVADFSFITSGYTVNFIDQSTGGTSYTWGFGDGNFSYLTSPVYTYSVAGTYNVCLTVANPSCPNQIICKNVTVPVALNVNELTENEQIQLFPNPTRDVLHITISSENEQNYELKMTDLLGKTLFVQQVDATRHFAQQLNIKEYGAGTYLFFVNSKAHKIIIQ